MTSNESRRTPSDYNVELGDEITARAPSKRRRILGGIAVAVCLSVASLIIVLAAVRVERDRDAQSTPDSLQMEQLREGWRTLVGAAAIDAQRAADPVTVAAPVAPVAASAATATATAEPAPPAVTEAVIVPVPVRPRRAPAPLRARATPTGDYNSQPVHSAGRAIDNSLPIDVPTPVTPDGSSVKAAEQGTTGVGSEDQPPMPSDSASQPVPVQPDDGTKAPTPPPTGGIPDSEPAPTPPTGSAPVTPPTQSAPVGADPLPAP